MLGSIGVAQINCTLCDQSLQEGAKIRLNCGHAVHIKCRDHALTSKTREVFEKRDLPGQDYGAIETDCCAVRLSKMRAELEKEKQELRPVVYLCAALSAILLVSQFFAFREGSN